MARSAKATPLKIRVTAPGSLIAVIGLFVGFFGGYVGSRLLVEPHPLHWLSAFIAAVAGYIIGMLIYRWRGDIV